MFFDVFADFAVLDSFIGTLQFAHTLFLPHCNLLLECLELLPLTVLEGRTGEGVAFVVQEMLVDVDAVDYISGGELHGVLH